MFDALIDVNLEISSGVFVTGGFVEVIVGITVVGGSVLPSAVVSGIATLVDCCFATNRSEVVVVLTSQVNNSFLLVGDKVSAMHILFSLIRGVALI